MLTQADRGVDRAVLDAEHLGRTEIQVGQHAVALTGADRDGDPAPGRDALVGEQRAEARDRAPPHVNDERRGEDAGKLHGPSVILPANRSYPGDYRVLTAPVNERQRAAISRARRRSSWLSTSTQPTSPMGAIPIMPPRSANSWKPSS